LQCGPLMKDKLSFDGKANRYGKELSE
jgi:hypothetical protein